MTNTHSQLGSLTFASQPPIPIQILDLWHTCDTVIIRGGSAQTPQQVQGFDALIVTPSTNPSIPYQIMTTYGEFNSGAWLANLGHPECNATANTRRLRH